ncbi:MAG: polyprenyl diphosphate synthase, partial [Methylovirgula sp.]
MIGAEAATQVKPAQAASSQPATPPQAKTRDVPALQGRVPRHVGVIMDGNGRWASSRGLPRIEGHRRGVEALRATVRAAIDFGLDYLTVYSFSSENWSRPVEEISDLMGLLKFFIRNDLAELARAGVKIKVIGTRANLKPDILALLEEAESTTAANSRLNLVVA